MPRRRALTGVQLAGLLALPTTEAELARHWALGDADLAAVGQRRRDHNRLGFALQLCVLRYPGRQLRPGEVVPERTLRFVAEKGSIALDGISLTLNSVEDHADGSATIGLTIIPHTRCRGEPASGESR